MKQASHSAPMAGLDFDVHDFASVLGRLEPHLPISDAFERAHPQERGTWWSSQQEHMVRWFRSQASTGTGAYSRQEPNRSARTTYNRLLAPAALLWMAEALGELPSTVQAAADVAAAEPNRRRRAGLVRRHLPWERIAQLAASHR